MKLKFFHEFFNHTHFGPYKDWFYIKFHIWKWPVGCKYSFWGNGTFKITSGLFCIEQLGERWVKVKTQNLTSQKFNLAAFIAHPAGALRNLNNKTSSKGCRILLCTYKYPFCGIILAASDVALKNPNVKSKQ